MVGGGQARIHHAGIEIACYHQRLGCRERAVVRVHLHGIVPCRPNPASGIEVTSPTMSPGINLPRPLADYEQVAARCRRS